MCFKAQSALVMTMSLTTFTNQADLFLPLRQKEANFAEECFVNPQIQHTLLQHTQSHTRICLFTRELSKKGNKKSGHYGEDQKSHQAPCGVKNANVIKNRWNINNTGAWSSICKQESLTSTGRLFPLIIPRLPLVIISTQSQSSSKQPEKINSRLQKVFPTATQLLYEWRKVLRMTRFIHVINISATVQLRSEAAGHKKASIL